MSNESIKSDPICGNCFSPLSKHFHEREVFCFADTTGDTFTDEPLHEWVLEEMCSKNPDLYESIVSEWKQANGHGEAGNE